jgi:hypothetical protein
MPSEPGTLAELQTKALARRLHQKSAQATLRDAEIFELNAASDVAQLLADGNLHAFIYR